MSQDDDQPDDTISRRGLLGLGAAAAGAAAAGQVLGAGEAGAVAAAAAFPVAPHGTTLASTLVHGQPGALGYRHMRAASGEATRVRRELLGGAVRGRGTRVPLSAFVQFTDMHIVDAQSPARVEFLDRLNDASNPASSVVPFSAAYRPWEMLSTHVAESMVRRVNAVAVGPVTGRAFDFTVTTGDNADNTQLNELRWQIDILDGGRTVRPDSGSRTAWEGVGGEDDLDPAYWHPGGTPPLGSPDNYTAKYGYPTVPGLLDACRLPFRTRGLRTPWYTVFGNHDGLVTGNIPGDAALNAVAVGPVKPIGLPTGLDAATVAARLAAGDLSVVTEILTDAPVKAVTPDPDRRLLSQAEIIAEHFTTHGLPVGHGYTQDNVEDGTAYYSFTQGQVHFVTLDTVNRNGYDDGSITTEQLAWLTAELEANSSRHLGDSGRYVAGTGTDHLIVVFSHHTIDTMGNVIGLDRVNGTTVRDLLLRYPNVVAWVNGHTHVNSVQPHARTSGARAGSGFWEINTASHVDWPQQCRIVEIVDNGDGTVSLFGTMVEHCAAPATQADPRTPLQLASLSRELAVNDPQRLAETARTDGRRGTAADRNVELLVKRPY